MLRLDYDTSLVEFERSDLEVICGLFRCATRAVFDVEVPLEGMAPVIESFERGWKVEVSPSMPSTEVLAGIDSIAGLRTAATRLGGGDSPARLASAVEFILEGLHLSNRLNKSTSERGSLYTLG